MFGSGILLALANLIPGVSGGTIAVVCKIYDKLLAVFSLDFKKIKTEWKSYLFLILGMIIGIFGLSYLIKYLLDNFPLQSNFFFLGIILGSIPMIYDLIITAITERNFLFFTCTCSWYCPWLRDRSKAYRLAFKEIQQGNLRRYFGTCRRKRSSAL